MNSVKYNPAISKTSEKKNKLKSISFVVGYKKVNLKKSYNSLNTKKLSVKNII